MILYIARHAWAGHFGDPAWPDDFQRPLDKEGRKRFRKAARLLAARGVAPTLIATSPLVRCRQTAELLAAAMTPEQPLVELDALRPGSDLPALVAWTVEQAKTHDEIAWVGHAPDVDRMTAALIGPGGNVCLAKGATAAVRFDDAIAPGAGELRWLVTAKMLGC
ncbi:MAG TPA: histidine phosphatase family protein [Thermoguttaceae bacterium]|nr:histidine phosphatase family protein [Thermoguttaceae bacterium]